MEEEVAMEEEEVATEEEEVATEEEVAMEEAGMEEVETEAVAEAGNELPYLCICERLKTQHPPQPKLIAPDTKMLYWLWRTILLLTIVKPSPNRKLEAGTPSSNARCERC